MSQSPDDDTSIDHGSQFYSERATEFIELHDQVQTSIALLDSLESFLSKFQSNLSAVSGQISNLQERSKDIEERLKGRRKIERPLSQLLLDICVPPALAILILDTPVGEPWIAAISEFRKSLESLKGRMRVKAARDLAEIAEALRIVAATKLRAFFLAIFVPIRTNMSTNMQVIQTSILLKYRSLFIFLQHHALDVAQEVQRSYVAAARVYYETGFRRYIRSLGVIKGRMVDKSELVGSTSEMAPLEVNLDRLENGRIDGPSVTLGYLSDDKNYKAPPEALFRSMLLVLMDNATAEYSFITEFFEKESRTPAAPLRTLSIVTEDRTDSGSEGRLTIPIATPTGIKGTAEQAQSEQIRKDERKALDAIWKQALDPVLDYCTTFAKSTWEPAPPVVTLLTQIRLNDQVFAEVSQRSCPPLETFLLGLRLEMWPIFQREMNTHVDSVKRLADSATGGLLARGNVKDSVVQIVCQRYTTLFGSVITLIDEDEEPMLFSNLGRLRTELNRLITAQATKVKEPAKNAAYLATIYEGLLRSLSNGPRPTTHPNAQMETAFWREREEEARRRMASTRR